MTYVLYRDNEVGAINLDMKDTYTNHGHKVTVVDHYVFFMSGSYKVIGSDGNVSDWTRGKPPSHHTLLLILNDGATENSLFSLDLKSEFPVEDLLSTDVIHNISIPQDLVPNIKDQTLAPWSGALFSTNHSLYVYGSGTSLLFGGNEPDSVTQHTLASYNSSTGRWTSVSPLGGSFNGDARLWGSSTSDPLSGSSFFTGGANNVQGMLEFNASDPNNITWTNYTEGHGLNGRSPDVIAGGMVFLPFGQAGVLLLLGGANVSAAEPRWRPSG